MDAVMDLTARAVSFITLIQDTFLRASVPSANNELTPAVMDVYGNTFPDRFNSYITIVKALDKEKCAGRTNGPDGERPVGFESKVLELVWFSNKSVDETGKQLAEQYVVELCTDIVLWINANQTAIIEKVGTFGAFSPPYVWREAISEIVYSDIDQRIALAVCLEYLPIHIVLALGGTDYEAGDQRILQWWQTNKKQNKITLNEDEQKLQEKFKKFVYGNNPKKSNDLPGDESINNFYWEKIIYLFGHYKELTEALLKNDAPLPFEYVFNEELDEIKSNRILRAKELLSTDELQDQDQRTADIGGNGLSNNAPGIHNAAVHPAGPHSCDPFVRARNMKLFAVAFSGGGIRSATFNLGILQGLSRQGMISRIDYLSTVSGGGYIGSWLATWIKRQGSIKKITDRLNPEKSADPFGEEVRPIRWLRMFSNYFTPNKSIMSLDSWTVGVTWLRNTLLNQLVIFLVLLAVLLLARSFYQLWFYKRIWAVLFPGLYVYITACLFSLIIALFTGIGMQWYNRGRRQTMLPFNLHNSHWITVIILLLAITGSYMVSASLFTQQVSSFPNKLLVLWPAGLFSLIVLLIIAWFGRYDKCIASFGKTQIGATFILIYTAFFSAIVGWLSLAGAWKLFELIKTFPEARAQALGFAFGLPIVLLVFGVTVVSRMALLGKYFPDERREWWGRMGAVINRVAFIWILVSAATYLARGSLNPLLHRWAPATLGGWMALVGGTVKAAFSSKTSGKDETKGFQATALDLLSKAGPYLFALGILIFLPALIDPLMSKPGFPEAIAIRPWLKALILAVIFFIPGVYLSWKLGVNEFSMHHFYRNRLIRAYLGATRRRSSRERTANPFTGFDSLDDEKLSKFTNGQGYFGPYPILNTALNASQVLDLSRQDRKAESFIFSPLYCGFDFSTVRSSVNSVNKSYDYGFRRTEKYAYPNDDGPGIGTAMAISGAAVNANQGYHSSAGTAFLLTVFNVQMGWWIGNPRKGKWQQSDPDFGLGYIFYNLTGQTNTKNEFVCLSDGGHFDNMGLYEMVRRRCAFIILGDSEQDENFSCEGFANAIRRCRIDFGAEIVIDIDDIVKRENHFSKQHYAIGEIRYSGDKTPTGVILYIKSSITGDEPVDVTEYAKKNPTFPHQTTADQFFDEEQFESYRKLGMHIADMAMSDRRVMKALNLKYKESADERDNEITEKPIKLFKTLKDFFTKNS
ncbi:MAG: Patatin-like phospholipase [Ferruginibacter sp.]|nr:Patatin-like phospholipase [Ferruginibacter sp.]